MGRGAVGRIARVAIVFSFVVSAGLFHTWLRVDGLDHAYRLSALNQVHERLLLENERLRIEVATLKAPVRIERLAREQLGMRTPRPDQIFVLQEEAPARAERFATTPRTHLFATLPNGIGGAQGANGGRVPHGLPVSKGKNGR